MTTAPHACAGAPSLLFTLVVAIAAPEAGTVTLQPNPPDWPATVRIFRPHDDPKAIRAAVDAAFAVNGGRDNKGQFSEERFAFLFAPGRYNVDVPVGYYTQVAGLGNSPMDVVFESEKGVHCQEGGSNVNQGALETFWRIAENFRSKANHSWHPGGSGMLWATSQAAPLRRVIVEGDLFLEEEGGYSSGGFVANCKVAGQAFYGSQQQYFTRNSDIGSSSGGVWNMVFVGTEGAPEPSCGRETGGAPMVTVESAPKVAEKPFVTVGEDDLYYLNVPSAKEGRRGTDFHVSDLINFNYVFVADAKQDDARSINMVLEQGLHVVLSPGIYYLDEPLKMVADRQVLLGLGLATLVPTSGNAAIEVGDADGVRVAGVLIEAGQIVSDVLLDWGPQGGPPRPGDADNPGFMHDVFVRVGGPAKPENPQARVMVRVNSGHVVGDNLWLWRADHTHTGIVKDGANPCDVALIVNGNDVTMYGLAAEHTLTDQVQWYGNRGETYFFQAELPYDVDEAYGTNHYVGYRVGNQVTEHKAYGVGVYHYFRDHPVVVEAGVVAPGHLADSFISPLSVYLNGLGTVKHVFNQHGESTGPSAAHDCWWCPRPEDIDTNDGWLPPTPPRPSRPPSSEVPTKSPEPVVFDGDRYSSRPTDPPAENSGAPPDTWRNAINWIVATIVVLVVAACVLLRGQLVPWLQETSYSLVQQLRADEADTMAEIRALNTGKEMQTKVPGDPEGAAGCERPKSLDIRSSIQARRGRAASASTAQEVLRRHPSRAATDIEKGTTPGDAAANGAFVTRVPSTFAGKNGEDQEPRPTPSRSKNKCPPVTESRADAPPKGVPPSRSSLPSRGSPGRQASRDQKNSPQKGDEKFAVW